MKPCEHFSGVSVCLLLCRCVCDEIISTEKVYVEELHSIIQVCTCQ